MKIVTVATHNDRYYSILQDSCKRYNLELITLGWGKKWTGFTMKYELFMDFLNNAQDDEIIMFIDAYDVIINEGEKDILNKFYSYNKKILISYENNIFIKLFFSKCNNVVLNSGTYMGYVKYIKEMIKLLYKPKLFKKCNNDDQEILNYVCKKNKPFFDRYVGIDYNKDIFSIFTPNIYYSPYYIISKDIGIECNNNILYYKNKRPSVFHFTGNLNFDRYVKCLGYDTNKIKKITYKNFILFRFYQSLNIIKNRIHILIILGVLIYIIFNKF